MDKETPEQAWNALLSMPKETAISLLSHDQTWYAILSHLIPDTAQRAHFRDHFFNAKAAELRAKQKLKAKSYNQQIAHLIYYSVNINKADDPETEQDNAARIGNLVLGEIRNGNPKTFKHLETFVRGKRYIQSNEIQYSEQWLDFCEFVIDFKRLPRRHELIETWEDKRMDRYGNKESIESNYASELIAKFGLFGLPLHTSVKN